MKQLTINKTGWWEFATVLKTRKPFKTYGNLRGHPINAMPTLGHLPNPWRNSLMYNTHLPSYVVYSYETPIAWYYEELDQWYMPDLKYSVSTSKAQGRILPALYSFTNPITH